MKRAQTLELLAPARNLECGIAAISHGADAVYIGAERFGARQAAGNSLADIKQLVDYAHRFLARVYVTVNTIIYDDELQATEQLIRDLYNIGVDAILVQDMAVMQMELPPIAIHASTQTDNRTSAKVRWLSELGMSRVVLARELSLSEISAIHKDNPDVELEAFVHGALCVSYSGQCYASCYMTGRSANRGECSQICRLPYRLIDGEGQQIGPVGHFLSLQDMCRLYRLEDLAYAGICSFKIEGRLKDVDYVKNIVAAYSEMLNRIVWKNEGRYVRSSLGKVNLAFKPDPERSFNRGLTPYFLDERVARVASITSPKSVGQRIGTVKEVGRTWFTIATIEPIANGDGLCYYTHDDEGQPTLSGIRINKVENGRLYPLTMPRDLARGTTIYRNHDKAFVDALSRKSAERHIPVDITIKLFAYDVDLRMTVSESQGLTVQKSMRIDLQPSRSPQTEGIRRTLSKLGGTAYSAATIDIDEKLNGIFIPMSQLADLRRTVVESLDAMIAERAKATADKRRPHADKPHFADDEANPTPWSSNIANRMAMDFYRSMGSERIEQAFELNPSGQNARRGPLMQCRYCLRYELGYCLRRSGAKARWKEPWSLVASDGSRLRLEFDCRHCQMNVWAEKKGTNK